MNYDFWDSIRKFNKNNARIFWVGGRYIPTQLNSPLRFYVNYLFR